MSGALIAPQFDSADLVEAAIDAPSIVTFGPRPTLLSGRKRRARTVVPEQASLFSFQLKDHCQCLGANAGKVYNIRSKEPVLK